MRLLKTFLRPGWLLLAIFVITFAAACFTVLAPWQLGKNTATEHRNDLIRTATSTDPVPLAELQPGGRAFDADNEWRLVSMRGHFLNDKQVVIRLRHAEGRPAVEVVTPFAVAGTDRVVFIDRGFLPLGENNEVSVPPAPEGEVSVVSRLRKTESTSAGKKPRDDGGELTAYTVDTRELAPLTGFRNEGFYLQISDDQPGSLGSIPLPQLESGPYLSYGLQWLAFGIMAPLGAGYFIYSEVKARRLAKKQNAEAIAAGSPGDGPEPAEETTATERRAERDRIRAQLRGAGVFTGNDMHAKDSAEIGAGAAADADAAGDVKAKLARRYGK
ncbi:SURF1 family protein [Gordonia shandongensis]|uniref:SURF1 family cytochrome oxidase biogenesis protein n=1 Tax=Gordonia shandongensis TaxID=376351 RepID=UPI000422F0B3|nr:SURF1 family cytochrome oxidase biogenesis protein [Gordonia shandongensis]